MKILLLLFLLFPNYIYGQIADTVFLKSKEYTLIINNDLLYRYEDPSSLTVTCGFMNPMDSFFYSCNKNKVIRINNTDQQYLLDGSGCCSRMNKNILFNIYTENYILIAKLKKIKKCRFSKDLLLILKKNAGIIQIPINDTIEKNKIKSLKRRKEYIFKLMYK